MNCRRSRWIVLYILGLICFPAQAATTVLAPDSLHVVNVQFEATQDEVLITYDFLTADQGSTMAHSRASNEQQTYTITVMLKREHDESFSYTPREVSGDIGAGVTEGPKKKILWFLSKEFARGLEGDDFYFVILVEPTINQQTNSWLWIGASVAVIGGTAAALLLLRGTSEPGSPQPLFPGPPGRPR